LDWAVAAIAWAKDVIEPADEQAVDADGKPSE
jgi:hypothetical protein